MRAHEPTTACQLLVIGYGNTLRSDDGVGVRVAQAVGAQGLPGVVALAVHQLTPELAECLALAERAVFVDARLAKEGTDIDFSPVEPSSAMGSGGHISDPRSLLAMAEWLYGHAPRAWLLTFPGAEFSIGEDLSAMAARGIDRALERIAILARRWPGYRIFRSRRRFAVLTLAQTPP